MKKLAPALVLGAGALWGTTGLFYRLLSRLGLNDVQVIALRIAFAAILLLLYLLLFDRSALKIRLRDVWMFLGTGVVSLFSFNCCYFSAISQTGMPVAAILLYTAPIFVILLSAVLFHERLTGVKLAALGMTFVGCVLVAGPVGGQSLPLTGILAGLGAGLGYALYSIFSRVALRRYSSLTISIYTFLFASAAALPFSRPWEILSAPKEPLDWFLALGIGVFTCLFPYLLYTKGLSFMENGRAAILATIEPVVAVLLGLLLGDTITPLSGIGIVLILAAILLLNVIKPGGARKEGQREEKSAD